LDSRRLGLGRLVGDFVVVLYDLLLLHFLEVVLTSLGVEVDLEEVVLRGHRLLVVQRVNTRFSFIVVCPLGLLKQSGVELLNLLLAFGLFSWCELVLSSSIIQFSWNAHLLEQHLVLLHRVMGFLVQLKQLLILLLLLLHELAKEWVRLLVFLLVATVGWRLLFLVANFGLLVGEDSGREHLALDPVVLRT